MAENKHRFSIRNIVKPYSAYRHYRDEIKSQEIPFKINVNISKHNKFHNSILNTLVKLLRD